MEPLPASTTDMNETSSMTPPATTAKPAVMRTRQRPVSQQGTPPPPRSIAAKPTRKIFNCIVDDSALVAGVKKSTRNGIRQWVRNGQIRLFVPLHALEELSRQKGGKHKHAEDVRETLQWLDEATTKHPNVVTLQGADETYEKWAEVEKHAVPRGLFSEYDHDLETEAESNGLSEDVNTKLDISNLDVKGSVSSQGSAATGSLSPSSLKSVRSSISALSPPTSPAKANASPIRNLSAIAAPMSRPQSSSASVPQTLQPLFNYILWRIHQENDPVAALESFIFLCNDERKVSFAKGFDIKSKRLEQLREAISREDRDSKNRQALLNRENERLGTPTGQASTENKGDAEAVAQATPPKAPAAMLQKHQTNVIDPNAFDRGVSMKPATAVQQPAMPPKSPHLTHSHRGPSRGAHALPFAPRGNMRGNMRGNFRCSTRGRGNFGPGRGGFADNSNALELAQQEGQIDPDSFSRPDARGGMNGGRGVRKLWVPT
ncbi:hypothetical protein DOTSEDRAFT_68887 [Dothistroma septosporum NZE10]|uniref:Uncharacterized protein n=1 Tax=Dothistroma septosporum (strain NZE10 / CBS 128990) TaxID=675120 RepID=N1Q5C6_DOTSN|nr:hypothetical protein DOTSEDRAFT_68887 [Dothistroma septosporum NZE10]